MNNSNDQAKLNVDTTRSTINTPHRSTDLSKIAEIKRFHHTGDEQGPSTGSPPKGPSKETHASSHLLSANQFKPHPSSSKDNTILTPDDKQTHPDSLWNSKENGGAVAMETPGEKSPKVRRTKEWYQHKKRAVGKKIRDILPLELPLPKPIAKIKGILLNDTFMTCGSATKTTSIQNLEPGQCSSSYRLSNSSSQTLNPIKPTNSHNDTATKILEQRKLAAERGLSRDMYGVSLKPTVPKVNKTPDSNVTSVSSLASQSTESSYLGFRNPTDTSECTTGTSTDTDTMDSAAVKEEQSSATSATTHNVVNLKVPPTAAAADALKKVAAEAVKKHQHQSLSVDEPHTQRSNSVDNSLPKQKHQMASRKSPNVDKRHNRSLSEGSKPQDLTENPSGIPIEVMHRCPIIGSWTLQESENWGEFLRLCGLGMVLRKIVTEMSHSETISISGDKWTIEMFSVLKNFSSTFSLGEEYEEENFDLKKVTSVASLDSSGQILTIEQKNQDPKGLSFIMSRQVNSDGRMLLLITCPAVNTSAKRYFVRSKET